MKYLFVDESWKDYLYWQKIDKKILKRINKLIKDILRNPFDGIGKPEPLKHKYRGFWSRRIDGEHRLIYSKRIGFRDLNFVPLLFIGASKSFSPIINTHRVYIK